MVLNALDSVGSLGSCGRVLSLSHAPRRRTLTFLSAVLPVAPSALAMVFDPLPLDFIGPSPARRTAPVVSTRRRGWVGCRCTGRPGLRLMMGKWGNSIDRDCCNQSWFGDLAGSRRTGRMPLRLAGLLACTAIACLHWRGVVWCRRYLFCPISLHALGYVSGEFVRSGDGHLVGMSDTAVYKGFFWFMTFCVACPWDLFLLSFPSFLFILSLVMPCLLFFSCSSPFPF